MLKHIAVRAIFLMIALFFFYILSISQTVPVYSQVRIEAKKVEYTLPYPGILPDHPLYFLKALRDRIIDITTRDYLKKAQLYVLFSDKRTAMAIGLAKKGKWSQASTTISKGEKYFLKIPTLIETSKKQGVSAEGDFILRVKLSNEKHREVLESLIKDAPQGERSGFEQILTLNREIKEKIAPF
ncbi:MAG TPA: DUF5667 domain-containing protein [Patescibacteria group bacterium]|nr:DUF5667 domain-containing protein [Patescibacteria group bacterium]